MRRIFLAVLVAGLLAGGVARADAQGVTARVAAEIARVRSAGGAVHAARAPLAAAYLVHANPEAVAQVHAALVASGVPADEATMLIGQVQSNFTAPPVFEACASGEKVAAATRLHGDLAALINWPTGATAQVPLTGHRLLVEHSGKLIPVSADVWFAEQGVRYTPRLLFAPGVEAALEVETAAHYQPEAGEFADALRSGETAPLYIADVGDPVGLGVFAAEDLAKGDLIGEYTGIVHFKENVDDNEYLMYYTLGARRADNEPLQRFSIDAIRAGNITRYVNHSYVPNAAIRGVVLEGRKHVLLVATEPIAAGEQVLFDYGRGYWAARGFEPIELRDPVPLKYREAVAETQPPTAPADYWELVGGNWVGSQGPGAGERGIASRFAAHLREVDAGIVAEPHSFLQLSMETKLRPDVVVYRERQLPVDGEAVVPRAVIEVLAPGSARMDLVWKKELYERSGVTEYWVVDPLQRSLTRFARKDSDSPTFYRAGVYTPDDDSMYIPFARQIDLGAILGPAP